MSSATIPEYNLRPRGCRRSLPSQLDQEKPDRRPAKSKVSKVRPPPLSKYRRRTANARERGRMQELNVAFERLRNAVPQIPTAETPGSRLTKITTLRLAVNYIAALTKVLQQDDLADEGPSDVQDSSLDQTSTAEFSADDEDLADFLMLDTENLMLWSDDETLQGSC